MERVLRLFGSVQSKMANSSLLLTLVLSAMLLVGCAGTASGRRVTTIGASSIEVPLRAAPSSAELALEPMAVAGNNAKKEWRPSGASYAHVRSSERLARGSRGLQVVIRYPALVSPSAQDALTVNYLGKPIEQRGRSAITNNSVRRMTADSRSTLARGVVSPAGEPVAWTAESEVSVKDSIIKTAYFAQEIYALLKARLPQGSVIQVPTSVALGRDGTSLVETSMLDERFPPSAVILDFYVYRHPDPSLVMEDVPITFGDLVTPLIVLRVPFSENGVSLRGVAASAPLLAEFDGSQQGRPEVWSFIEYLNEKLVSGDLSHDESAVGAARVSNAESRRALVFPLEKLALDKAVISSGNVASVPPLAVSFAGFGDFLSTFIAQMDVSDAPTPVEEAYLRFYDPSFSISTSLQGTQQGDEGKMREKALYRFEDVDRKFLVAQSDALFDAVYLGPFGQNVRRLLASELKLLEERRALARKQNLSAAISVATGVLGVYASALGDMQASNRALAASAYSANVAGAAAESSAALQAQFAAAFGSVYGAHASHLVALLNDEDQVAVRNYHELGLKIRERYLRFVTEIKSASDPARK